MDLLTIGLELAFIAVFLVVGRRFQVERNAVNRDLALIFGLFSVFLAITLIHQLWPAMPTGLNLIGTFCLMSQPLTTIWLTRHFRRISRLLGLIALAATALALGLILLPVPPPVRVYGAVGIFAALETWAAVLLYFASRGRIGNARTRLSLAALATLLFAVAIALVGIGYSQAQGRVEVTSIAVARLLALLAGLGYLLAFLPGGYFGRHRQHATAFDLVAALVAAAAEDDPSSLWATLARAGLVVTGGQSAAVLVGQPEQVVAAAGQAPSDWRLGGDAAALLAGLSQLPHHLIPISHDRHRLGTLVIVMPQSTLFMEEDAVLLDLLGRNAALAIERTDAVTERAKLAGALIRTSAELVRSRALLEGEERFRVALEAHPGPILVSNGQDAIEYANVPAGEAFGAPVGELIGQPITMLLPGLADEDDNTSRVLEASRADGARFVAEVAVSTFDFQDESYRIWSISDITARREQEELRERFIGILSHELRTPVTSIYGLSQVLAARADSLDRATTAEMARDMAAESERLQRLVENLLILARAERGEGVSGGEPVLVSRLIKGLIDASAQTWPGLVITLDMPLNLPTVSAEPDYLRQVLINLINNAVKYAEDSEVSIVGAVEGTDVTIRVLDRGAGVEGEAGQLFDLYYRAPGADMVAPGAGIGLFVCRQIIASFGGRIWAADRPGGGAEFGFSLPIYQADEADLDAEG